MSFDIGSVGRTPAASPAAGSSRPAAVSSSSAQDADTVTVDTIPASPPDEVHDAIGVANQAYHNLKATGSEMRFKVNEATGKLSVEVHDVHGNLLFTVPASTALDVASGGSLPSPSN
ncbi:MAG TPA: hypothetical protein VMB27_09445 [Solirubrobacteraceae bacterium]|nr:hypothetical protein [Solirubrobacteraceae bacterium]